MFKFNNEAALSEVIPFITKGKIMFVTDFDKTLHADNNSRIQKGGYYKGTIILAKYNVSQIDQGKSLEIDLQDEKTGEVAKIFLTLQTKSGSIEDQYGNELFTRKMVNHLLAILKITQTENFSELVGRKIGFKVQMQQKQNGNQIYSNFNPCGFYEYESDCNYKEIVNLLPAMKFKTPPPADIIIEPVYTPPEPQTTAEQESDLPF